MATKKYSIFFNIALIAILSVLFFLGNVVLFNLVYIGIFIFVAVRMLTTQGKKRYKLLILVAYLFVMTIQLVAFNIISAEYCSMGFQHMVYKLFATVLVPLPLLIGRYITVGKYAHLYLPSFQEVGAIGFSELLENRDRIVEIFSGLRRVRRKIRIRYIKDILGNMPRHDSFRYVNKDSLTPEFFENAEQYLDDPYLYIIISNTGSPASELLSVVTHNHFNHASISFDAELETILSYNGGDRVYPPGLNYEMIEYFQRKDDSSILVYRLSATRAQKENILNAVRRINLEGSAYNMLGILTNQSYKPNIMYCSQFVYRMLETAGLAYFTADRGVSAIRPTDFIEKDYHRNLEFLYELKLSEN